MLWQSFPVRRCIVEQCWVDIGSVGQTEAKAVATCLVGGEAVAVGRVWHIVVACSAGFEELGHHLPERPPSTFAVAGVSFVVYPVVADFAGLAFVGAGLA